MTQELTEQEFIDMFSEANYESVARLAYENMRETEEFKNDLPVMTSIMVFPVKTIGGKHYTLVCEANLKKIGRVQSSMLNVSAVDFGIARLWISDEEMPDVALDRYNEYMKVKKQIESENKK